MLFDVLPDGTLRLVSEEDEDIQREFQQMDNVRDMLAALAWTEASPSGRKGNDDVKVKNVPDEGGDDVKVKNVPDDVKVKNVPDDVKEKTVDVSAKK